MLLFFLADSKQILFSNLENNHKNQSIIQLGFSSYSLLEGNHNADFKMEYYVLLIKNESELHLPTLMNFITAKSQTNVCCRIHTLSFQL